MEETGVVRIRIAARIEGLGDDALCAFIARRGGIEAAVNARLEDEATAHIRQHATRGGVTGVQLCSRDCQVTEPVRGQSAAI